MRLSRPQAAIGHVRLGTSGHLGIPDPHPFVRPHPRRAPGASPGLLFAHNGSLDAYRLRQRIGRSYLETHPPDYGTMTELDVQHIDSELYYIYLLKLVEERPELPFAEALLEAVRAIAMDDEVTAFNPRLNFVMTDGDTLYAMNYYGETNSKPLYYYPQTARNDPPIQSAYWVVASEPLGSTPGWSVLPARTLAVFVPGQAPRLLPLDASPDPVFTLDDVEVFPQTDADCDGWVSSFTVCCDPNVNAGAWQVSVSLLAAPAGTDDWSTLDTARAVTIEGAAGDSICVTGFVDPPSLRASTWDLKLLLTEYSSGDTVAVATAATHPGVGLDSLRVEGAQRDTIPDPPARLQPRYGHGGRCDRPRRRRLRAVVRGRLGRERVRGGLRPGACRLGIRARARLRDDRRRLDRGRAIRRLLDPRRRGGSARCHDRGRRHRLGAGVGSEPGARGRDRATRCSRRRDRPAIPRWAGFASRARRSTRCSRRPTRWVSQSIRRSRTRPRARSASRCAFRDPARPRASRSGT